jgi:predicted phage terminase large subunit-like protein
VNDPLTRILITSATATNAQKFIIELESIWEQNEIFRWLFDELIPEFNSVRWNNSEMEIRRAKTFTEASVEALGVGGTAVSRHFDEQIKDDWVNEDHIQYPEQMEKLIEFYKHSISLFVSPARGYDTVVGTRWSHSDLIQHILDTGTVERLGQSNPFAYEATIRSAIENGEPIYPVSGLGEPEFTKEHLEAILEAQGPYVFSCQYLNQPTHEDSRSFQPSWNRYYTQAPEGLRCFTAVDPATGRGDSFSGIATVGAHHDGTLYVLDVTKANLGADELIEEIIRHYMQWHSKVGMETIAFQKVLMLPLREAMRRYGISFSVQELQPGSSQKKEFRIAGILQPAFASGKIFLRSGMKELERELSWFPALAHFDLLDALSYAVQMAKYPSKFEAKTRSPLDVDVIMEELEARNQGNGDDIYIWNKRPKDTSEFEPMESLVLKLQKPPFSMSEEQARKLVSGGAYVN